MYIYLNSELPNFSNSLWRDENDIHRLGSMSVHSALSFPYLDTKSTDPISLSKNPHLQEFFLKAVSITFPKYMLHREYGKYVYGKATAELRPAENDRVADALKIETLSIDGLEDIMILKEKLWSGDILPIKSYEKPQISKTKNFLMNLISKK